MKMPKVSAVYEGRRGRRWREGGYWKTQEEINESRLARVNARARRYLHLPNANLNSIPSFTNPQNSFIIRSMSNNHNMVPFMDINNTFVSLDQQPPQQEMGCDVVETNKIEMNQDCVGVDHFAVLDNPNPIDNDVLNNIVVGTTTNQDSVVSANHVFLDNQNPNYVLNDVVVETNQDYVSVDHDDVIRLDNSSPTNEDVLSNINLVERESDEVRKPIFDATFARMDDVEGKGEWWEEWPFRVSYEEELMWAMNSNDPNSDVASNTDSGVEFKGSLDDEQIWGVDLWNFGDINDFPRID